MEGTKTASKKIKRRTGMGYRVGMVIWNTGDRIEHGRATLMIDQKNFRAIKNQRRLSADEMV